MVAGNNLQVDVTSDFNEIWSHYSKISSTRVEKITSAKTQFRLVHRFGFVAAILSKSIPPQRAEHKRIFLKELSSDSIHILHALLTGEARGAQFYLRSAVENFWRHVYFKDHPVEYRWLQNDPKFYVSLEELRSYCAKHDEIDGHLQNSLNRIAGGYQKLSRFVHSSKRPGLQVRSVLAEIQLSRPALLDIVKDLRAFGRDLILTLLVLHADEMAKLNPREQRFAVNFLDVERKRVRIQSLT